MTVCIEDIKSTIQSTDLTYDQVEKLAELIGLIPYILSKLDNPKYDEIYGFRINTIDQPYVVESVRNEILLKFLAHKDYDVELAGESLIKTLNWRNEFQPLSAAFSEKFDEELNNLGAIIYFPKSNLKVSSWNIYGNLKNSKNILEYNNRIGKVELPGSQFLRWRIGLMEKSLQIIDFTSKDNSKVAQIHDYKNVSFLKPDSGIKKATNEIVAIFGDHYPEVASTKFFINVPLIMGGTFKFFKNLGMIGKETLNKFQVSNNGDMSKFFSKTELPKNYGGIVNENLLDLDVEKHIKLRGYGEIVLRRITG